MLPNPFIKMTLSVYFKEYKGEYLIKYSYPVAPDKINELLLQIVPF